MVMRVCDPSEVEARESEVQGYLQLCQTFEASLGYAKEIGAKQTNLRTVHVLRGIFLVVWEAIRSGLS